MSSEIFKRKRNLKQITIAKRVEGVGIGLHKGEPIKLILEPLEADSGIVFIEAIWALVSKPHPKMS